MKRVKFPILLSLQGSTSDYIHAVVVWQNQIIDFQNVSRIKLTLRNLRSCLGSNTVFFFATCGYGLIPSKATKQNMKTDHVVKEIFGTNCLKDLFHGV